MKIEMIDSKTFKFENRGTLYTVINSSETYGYEAYSIWTSRKVINGLSVKVMSAEEMKNSSVKVIKKFYETIKMMEDVKGSVN